MATGKKRWNKLTDEQKKNTYSSYTGVAPEHVDLTGMDYNDLPKDVKKGVKQSQLKAKLLKMKLAAAKKNNHPYFDGPVTKRKADKAVKDVYNKTSTKNEIPQKIRELEGTNEVGDKRIPRQKVDQATHTPNSLRSFTKENAKKYAISIAKSKVNKLKKKYVDPNPQAETPEEIMQSAESAGREPSYIAQEHGHRISFRAHSAGNYKTASLNEQSGKYAKYWLLNAKDTNGNGWGIAAHTAKDNMKKFIGRPLVVTASSWHGASEYGDQYEHPYLPTNDITAILDHQEKFRVGSIVDVVEDSHGDWYANVEMLPKFANSRLPPFCSPAIYQLDASEAEGQISKWEALHLAALTENPAYGARIALLKGTCVGTGSECKVQFKSAKQLVAESPCHDNYEMIGTKSKDGRKVPNCVPSKQAKTVCPKKKQKISRLKQRLAYEGGSNYDRQITDLSKNFESQRNEITKRRPDNLVPRQPKNAFGHVCTNEATCGATSGFLGVKLMSEHGLNHKQVKVEGGMYTGPGGEFASGVFRDNDETPTVGHEWIRLDDGTIIDGSVGQFMDQKNKINQKQRLRVIPPNAPLQKYYKGHYSRNPMMLKREWYDKNDPLKKGIEKYERMMRKGKEDPTEKVIREVKDPEKKKDLLNRLDKKPNEYGPKNYGATKPKNFGKKIGKLKQRLAGDNWSAVEDDDFFTKPYKAPPIEYSKEYGFSAMDHISNLHDEASYNAGQNAMKKFEGLSHPLSKKFAFEAMDNHLYNSSLMIQNNYPDIEDIVGNNDKDSLYNILEGHSADTLEHANYRIEDKFGFGEESPQPQNEGEELGRALFEPFERMKDEEYAQIPDRKGDMLKTKDIINEYTNDVSGGIMKSFGKYTKHPLQAKLKARLAVTASKKIPTSKVEGFAPLPNKRGDVSEFAKSLRTKKRDIYEELGHEKGKTVPYNIVKRPNRYTHKEEYEKGKKQFVDHIHAKNNRPQETMNYMKKHGIHEEFEENRKQLSVAERREKGIGTGFDHPNIAGYTAENAVRWSKLKTRLANLGEQNMTYQDSKKVKIHKKKNMEKHDKS